MFNPPPNADPIPWPVPNPIPSIVPRPVGFPKPASNPDVSVPEFGIRNPVFPPKKPVKRVRRWQHAVFIVFHILVAHGANS